MKAEKLSAAKVKQRLSANCLATDCKMKKYRMRKNEINTSLCPDYMRVMRKDGDSRQEALETLEETPPEQRAHQCRRQQGSL